MGHSWDIQFTAFACNAESFAIAFLYFLFFSFSSVFLERLTRVLSFNAKKRVSVRNVPLVVLRDVCGPWDTTCFGLFILTSIHNIQKGNSWKLGNRMEDESRFKAQKTEKSSWYVKKSEEKENTKYSKKKNLIDTTCESNINTSVEKQVSPENINSVSMMNYTVNLFSSNHQTNTRYSRSTRSI